jgi:hypothetical protein
MCAYGPRRGIFGAHDGAQRNAAPRSSKIVEAESPARDSAISKIDGLAMSATATRLDAVVLLPVCCLHHLFDARPLGLTAQRLPFLPALICDFP